VYGDFSDLLRSCLRMRSLRSAFVVTSTVYLFSRGLRQCCHSDTVWLGLYDGFLFCNACSLVSRVVCIALWFYPVSLSVLLYGMPQFFLVRVLLFSLRLCFRKHVPTAQKKINLFN